MSKKATGGAAAELSREDLLALVNSLQQEKEQSRRLAGVTIECVEGTSKAGKPFKVLQVKGGDLGWRGLNLKPAIWRKLMELQDEISSALETHFPGE